MDFVQIKNVVSEFMNENFKTTGKIVELQKNEDRWISNIEIIEESDYVRRLGKTDIIGLYEVEISFTGEVLGYKRLLLRERGNLKADK
ncbi:hypothetical protein C4588_07670 [Candidatus Parcubacteria bacterium]|nr:MAG: hypothetical protein C4588_07670 [Candidatus Parcubacteria bacterium]